MIIVDRKILTNESVVCAELGDEAVLLNVESGIYFGLDAIGSRIWAALGERGATVDDVVNELLQEYDVDEAEFRADVEEFIETLAGKGLVRRADD